MGGGIWGTEGTRYAMRRREGDWVGVASSEQHQLLSLSHSSQRKTEEPFVRSFPNLALCMRHQQREEPQQSNSGTKSLYSIHGFGVGTGNTGRVRRPPSRAATPVGAFWATPGTPTLWTFLEDSRCCNAMHEPTVLRPFSYFHRRIDSQPLRIETTLTYCHCRLLS